MPPNLTLSSIDPSTPAPPVLSLERATAAVGHPVRWKLLAALSGGESLMVGELAARVGKSFTATSKQLITLRALGAVEITRRLHHLSRKLPQPAPGQVDFGYFLARFDLKAEAVGLGRTRARRRR